MTPSERERILANAPAVWAALKRLSDERLIRCGDIVLHRPTGEEWVVAYADYERDALAWSGWPECYAKISDCDLVACCTDEAHIAEVAEWLRPRSGEHCGDHRIGVIRRLYGEVNHG